MKPIRIDWSRHLPLGMDSVKTKKKLFSLLAGGMIWSLRFPLAYLSARASLFGYVNGKYQRIPHRQMLPFGELLQGTFTVMFLMMLASGIAAIWFYLYHYQGCRSIYTMKRLPNRWELWRRCVTVPAGFLLLNGLCALVLLGLYYLLWRYATPPDAFPL